jgi:hypothetical protein
MDDIEEVIARTLQQAIKNSLNIPRIHKTYFGVPKGGGKYGPYQSAPLSSGRLQNSVEVFWERTNDGLPVLNVEFVNAPYWYYIKNGREPGTPIERSRLSKNGNIIQYTSYTKFPPLDSIIDWIDQKPITNYTDNLGRALSTNTMAYLIGRSIARDGYQGVDFIQEAWDASKNVLLPLFGERVAQYFTDVIREGIIINTRE